jgi:carbon starvation protein CstA
MITFLAGIVVLILGFVFYSRFIERFAEVDATRTTPAYSMKDGVDYVPMPWWRVFLIQFLNIAGLGPIFGAVAGAMWGRWRFCGLCSETVFCRRCARLFFRNAFH